MRSFRILTPYETELADAMFEAMFPSDGHSPDVREAGVTEYLDLTLEGYGRKELPKYQWLGRPEPAGRPAQGPAPRTCS
ncbi:hypothetical protein ACKLTP_18870, partial [Paenarthrobacter ureafaciens]|uniref:hypothetical protein n=1 Tax=Paenarthrobacter ureafaciens TaxID=37931 RepID=UPI00397A797E